MHNLYSQLRGPLFIILSSSLWAADSLFRVPLLAYLDSGVIVVLEHVIACAVLWPFFIGQRKKIAPFKSHDFFSFIFLGVVGSALATLFLTSAYRMINPSVAILLQKLQPIVSIALAHRFLKERLSKSFFVWTAMAIIGAILVSLPGLQHEPSSTNFFGVTLALFAVFAWGTSTVVGRRVSMRFDFITISYLRYLWGALALLAIFSISRFALNEDLFQKFFGLSATSFDRAQISLALNPGAFQSILYIGLFSGTLAMVFYYRGLKTTTASVAAIFEMFFPLLAVVLNWVFLGQKLAPPQICGAILLVVSSYFITKEKREDVL